MTSVIFINAIYAASRAMRPTIPKRAPNALSASQVAGYAENLGYGSRKSLYDIFQLGRAGSKNRGMFLRSSRPAQSVSGSDNRIPNFLKVACFRAI